MLSDRNIGQDRIAVSSLLATGAVHHHLVRSAKRTQIGIVLESGEAREVHHHCLLIGYGADAINPYLAFESLWQARIDGLLPGDKYDTDEKIVAAYRKAVAKGMLKVMAKMGISTLQSYKGAPDFRSPRSAATKLSIAALPARPAAFRVSALMCWQRRCCGDIAWVILETPRDVCLRSAIQVNSTGGRKANATVGIQPPSPTCKSLPAPVTKTPTGDSPSISITTAR